MCRLLIYSGLKKVVISTVVLDPCHSIVAQSYDCHLRLSGVRSALNADGFGIGWYVDKDVSEEPCILTSIVPAWNSVNLERVVTKLASNLIFGHVRAKITGMLTDANCHPFQYKSLLWMHNGSIGAWNDVSRPLAELVDNQWYHEVKGNTDSEWAFALFLTTLEEIGLDPSDQPERGFKPEDLRLAMERTIAKINALVALAPGNIKKPGSAINLLNFAVSDGHTVVASRYVNSTVHEPSSLFYCTGSAWARDETIGHFVMKPAENKSTAVLVASEPLTSYSRDWTEVPKNSMLTIRNHEISFNPIVIPEKTNEMLAPTKDYPPPDYGMMFPSNMSGIWKSTVVTVTELQEPIAEAEIYSSKSEHEIC